MQSSTCIKHRQRNGGEEAEVLEPTPPPWKAGGGEPSHFLGICIVSDAIYTKEVQNYHQKASNALRVYWPLGWFPPRFGIGCATVPR